MEMTIEEISELLGLQAELNKKNSEVIQTFHSILRMQTKEIKYLKQIIEIQNEKIKKIDTVIVGMTKNN